MNRLEKDKIENSILGANFVIEPKIVEVLDRLKKPCQVIIKDLSKEIETDEEDLFHVFSINNSEKVKLPKEIKRLEVYFNEYEYESSYKLLDDYGIDKVENVLVKDSYNLPDLLTLENLYPNEYKVLLDYVATLYKNNDEDIEYILNDAYSQLVKKYLGHDLYPTFIGGNINQMYVALYDYEDLNFLMQYQTYWGNGEIIFVFNTKENPLDIKIMVQH